MFIAVCQLDLNFYDSYTVAHWNSLKNSHVKYKKHITGAVGQQETNLIYIYLHS